MILTDNQLIHRAYLASDLWKLKRSEALAFYGCICNRCGCFGTDVHHKTYERTGGGELMEDLEILCRDCHDAHHRAERFSGKSKRSRRGIHKRAIFFALSKKHIAILMKEFPETGKLYAAINYGNPAIAERASKLLGYDYVYGIRKEINNKKI